MSPVPYRHPLPPGGEPVRLSLRETLACAALALGVGLASAAVACLLGLVGWGVLELIRSVVDQ